MDPVWRDMWRSVATISLAASLIAVVAYWVATDYVDLYLRVGGASLTTLEEPDAAAISDDGPTDDSRDGTGLAEAGPEGPGEGLPVGSSDSMDDVQRSVADAFVGTNLPEDLSSSSSYAELVSAVESFEAEGYTASVVIRDLTTGSELSYNATQDLYPASSVKGVYALWVYQDLVETGVLSEAEIHETVRSMIVESDNDAYDSLRETVAGLDTQPAADTGLRELLAELAYPHTAASFMADEWELGYRYLASGTDAADALAELFSEREVSPIRDGVGEGVTTWTKAGWFLEEDGVFQPATADCGVVLSDSGPYVLCVMTDAPGLLDELAPIAAAADNVHEVMVG